MGVWLSVRIDRWVKEDVRMSLASERESWLDRWWLLLVICFGLIFVSILIMFKPGA